MRYDAKNRSAHAATATFLILAATVARGDQFVMEDYPVPAGSRPHDVAPAPMAVSGIPRRIAGALGWLKPDTGQTHHIPLVPARGHTE